MRTPLSQAETRTVLKLALATAALCALVLVAESESEVSMTPGGGGVEAAETHQVGEVPVWPEGWITISKPF